METIKKMYRSATKPEMKQEPRVGDTGPAPPLNEPSSAKRPGVVSINPVVRQQYLAMKRERLPDEEAQKQQKQSKKKRKKNVNKHCIQKTTFKSIVNEISGSDITIASEACRLLQLEGEKYLSSVFEDAEVLSRLNGRKTVSLADIRGVLALACNNIADKKKILVKDPNFMTAAVADKPKDEGDTVAIADEAQEESTESSEEEDGEEDEEDGVDENMSLNV